MGKVKHRVRVYSLKINSWRVLKTIPFCRNRYNIGPGYNPNIGSLVNGALYWPLAYVSTPLNSPLNSKSHWILQLNFSEEKHSWVQPPSDANQKVELKLVVFKENKLCAYHNQWLNQNTKVIEMWILEEEEKELKWTTLISIQHGAELKPVNLLKVPLQFRRISVLKPLSFRRNGELVLQMGRNKQPVPVPQHLKYLDLGGLHVYNPTEESSK